ncbi:WD40-repeat-containing domain protein [Scleroderma yunnanense]
MANDQSRIRRLKTKLKRSHTSQVVPETRILQESPRTPTGITPTPARPGNITHSKLATLKNLLNLSDKRIKSVPSLATGMIDKLAAPEISAHCGVDATEKELEALVPSTVKGDVGPIDEINSSSQLEDINSAYLEPLKVFTTIVNSIDKAHPYARLALGVLTNAAQLVIAQAKLDNAVSALLPQLQHVYGFLCEKGTLTKIDTKKDVLACIAQVISHCVQFIKDYADTRKFWKRAGKNVTFETQTAIDAYNQALDDLMQKYRASATEVIQPYNIFRGHRDLNLEGMAYIEETTVNVRQTCLDGTRTEILNEIVVWIMDPDVNAPRIFWINGLAGQGKSTIVHTVAQWSKSVGILGSYFCFAGDRQVERRGEKMFMTIARDLANYDPLFGQALAAAVTKDPSLKTTRDVTQQWEKLLLEPMSKVSGIRNVVIVIDGLDENGPSSSRMHIMSALASKEVASLPFNFRILLTSRPLSDIQLALGSSPHVKAMSLNDLPTASTNRDIYQYINHLVGPHRGIEAPELKQMTQISAGLFEVARLAAHFLNPHVAGETAKERLADMVLCVSGEGEPLLDSIYRATLDSVICQRPTALERFCSVMRQVLYTAEPLSMEAYTKMRRQFSQKKDSYDSNIILSFIPIFLTGVRSRTTIARPLNASFYEFLSDQSRSQEFFSGGSYIQFDLALSSLRLLHTSLRFNICELESSYLPNSEVVGLTEKIASNIPLYLSYTCQHWAKHLQVVDFNPILAEEIRGILESEKVLFWFEVLSLVGGLENAAVDLASVARWLQGHQGYEDVIALAKDGVQFIHEFASAISLSTPHLYLSALALAPQSSVLCRALRSKFPNIAKAVVGQRKDWPTTQVLLQGHDSVVTSVALSPDGRRIVSGSNDMTVRVWDAECGVLIGNPLQVHIGYVQSVAFSPDGTRIVTGSFDTTLKLWDMRKGMQIGDPFQGHTGPVNSVAFSPNGALIVSGSNDMTVRLWDADRGVQIGRPLQGHSDKVLSVVFSFDGTKIVSGSGDNTVRLWDIESGVQIGSPLQGHSSSVQSVAFSSDGTKIVSGSADNTIRLWDVERGAQIGSPIQGHADGVQSVSFSPDGKRIVSGSSDRTVRVWDAENGVQIGTPLEGHTHWVQSVVFSPDGRKIVSGSSDRTLRIWDAESTVKISTPSHGHSDYIQSVAISSNGTRVVTGSGDKTVRVWDTKTGVQIGNSLGGHTHWVQSIAFSPNGARVVSGSSDRTLRIWDTVKGVQIGGPFYGHTGAVNSVAYSSNGKRIVSGSDDGTVRVWRAKGGGKVGKPLTGHTAPVQVVAFSFDGTRIVSGSSDKTVRIWNVKKGVQLGDALQGHTNTVQSVAFSPDGMWIVSGSWDKTVRIWDVKTGVQVGNPLEGHTDMVLSIAFSFDGARIVSGSSDKTVRIWDAMTNAQIGCALEGHTGWVKSVAFSSDGTEIVSASYDMTIRIWDARSYMQFSSSHNLKHPIYFSSMASHALKGGESLLDKGFGGEGKVHQNVRLHKDGWIRGSHSQLLLWIPHDMQLPFYDMWTKMIIPKGVVELDLSQMAHGNKWVECFKLVESS